MKKRGILLTLLLLVTMGSLQAQIYDESGQYVDTTFHDHINRQAEDFVLAYLCIAEPTDWRDDFLGVNGHAFIRLVCRDFDLDYCFSYESEGVNGQMLRYLQGKLKMGMFAIPTQEYIVDYQKWNRAVHQYRLNLPPEVEQRLWEIMDHRVEDGDQLKLDLNRRGCAVSAVRYIVRALGEHQIEYPENLPYENMTLREIQYQSMDNLPWLRLIYGTWLDNLFNQNCPLEGKLMIPQDVADIWQNSTINGEPVLTYDSELVSAPIVTVKAPILTPIRVVWVILLITLGLTLCHKTKTWTWILISLQFIAALWLIALIFITKQLPWSSVILMVIFNIFPLLLWRWRRYWQLPYAILLLVGVITLWLWPHMLVDPFYLMIALSYVVIFGFDPICVMIHCGRKNP